MSALKNKKKLLTMNSRGLWNHSLNTANQIWLASNDGPQICSIEANRTLTSPCSSQCLVRATRSLIEFPAMHANKALVVILTVLTFLRSYLWMVIWFTALNTTNIHKLCSNDRFVIWLARAHWQDRKLKAMSCWEFQSLMNLVMPSIFN